MYFQKLISSFEMEIKLLIIYETIFFDQFVNNFLAILL